jgi:glutathione peroxidase-family protein
MAPIVHGLEADYGDQMNFVYLDIDDPANDPFKEALHYRVQPHIFLIDEKGNVIQQWLGYVKEQDLRAAIQAALAN